jgi:hypothetical protein
MTPLPTKIIYWPRCARAAALNSRHSAAEATFDDAKAKLQRHHLEANLDADEKVRTKLEAAVGACAVTRDGVSIGIGMGPPIGVQGGPL